MTETPPDDARSGATEAQMRRALGLLDETQIRSTPSHSPTTANGSHLQRRRFVQDGEVPVTVIHRDHRSDETAGTNQLESARQAIRAQAAARERAERLLAEAQAMLRDLQTKLAHERLAKDELIQRADAEKQAREQALQSIRAELAAERLARQQAEAIARSAVEAQEIAAPARRDARPPPSGKRSPAVAGEVKRHRKSSGATKPGASKPVKWWLQAP
jgi:septal ring factor EnvC (AmiA/AmiB activator)